MKLMGNLKKKMENAHAPEEPKEYSKDIVKVAGMRIDDEDLSRVSGGDGCFMPFNRDQVPR